MKIVPGVRSLPQPLQRSALTIGNFDGVHLGHQALIGTVLRRAREAGGPAVVMTFEPHPLRALRPDLPFGRIFSLEDQRQQADRLGVDFLVIEPFSREFSRLEPDRFVVDWIAKPFSPSATVVGYDFGFGEGKRGTIDFLRASGARLGFDVEVLPPVTAAGQIVSSTAIRKALAEGDVRLAAELLGRRFYLEGLVERGAGRGRKLGWRTANLGGLSVETYPMLGVYCAWAAVDGEKRMALVNVGRNPTFASESATAGAPSVEAHILGLEEEVYGRRLRLDFVERLRNERRFESPQALAAQIGADVEAGKRILSDDAQLSAYDGEGSR